MPKVIFYLLKGDYKPVAYCSGWDEMLRDVTSTGPRELIVSPNGGTVGFDPEIL